MHEETLKECKNDAIKEEITIMIQDIKAEINALTTSTDEKKDNEYSGNMPEPITVPEPALSNRFLVTLPPQFGIKPEQVEFFFRPKWTSFTVCIRDDYEFSYDKMIKLYTGVKSYDVDIVLTALKPNNEIFRVRRFKKCHLIKISEDAYSYKCDEPHRFILEFTFVDEEVEECHNQ